MSSLIASDDIMLVWMAVLVIVAVSVMLAERYKWAANVSSFILCIGFVFLLTNIRVMPMTSTVYDSISSYVLLLAIPMLLFRTNFRKIFRESGRTLFIFIVCAMGAAAGSVAFGFFLHNYENIAGVAAMVAAGCTGGTVNVIAMAETYRVGNEFLTAGAIAGSFLDGGVMILLIVMSRSALLRRHFKHPHIIECEKTDQSDAGKSTGVAMYWKRKDISLSDMAKALASSSAIVGLSLVISGFVTENPSVSILRQLFGSPYLVMTLLSVISASVFPRFFENINGADEIGTIMLLMWIAAISANADFPLIVKYGGIVIIAYVFVVSLTLLFGLMGGKCIRSNLEEIMTSIIANIGGPATAAALAVGQGWKDMVAPGILVGLFGYVIGNYLGVLVYNIVANLH